MSDEAPQSQPPRLQFDFSAILVRITRELGIGIEHLRAEQLLTEARAAEPGDPAEMWAEWLTQGVRGLGLQGKQKKLTLEQALTLAQDGALIVGTPLAPGEPNILLDFDGDCAEIASADDDTCQRVEREILFKKLPADKELLWLIVSDLEFSHTNASKFADNPVRRFFSILRPEWSDIWVVAVFAFFAGVLGLATPIAVEALVNMVAFGRLIQPLLVLSILLFGFLAFAAMMRALQTFVVEIIQRRLFVRIAADLAYRFPRVTQTSLHGEYGPELANRFFDVVTLQKVVAQLLFDGLAIVLTTIVGMAVLAFYHPWLLGFDVLLLAIVTAGIWLLGRGAISTGIDESKKKYRLAAWLEDVIRCEVSFKTAGGGEFALDRANLITAEYLRARRRHFALLFRQILFILSLQALAGTILLGFGGWLVIQRQ
ncbi:MAG: ABC transporter ATP-binding protein, partial [Lacipirellulaceae bacterium]